MVTKRQIADGIAEFIGADLMEKVDDKQTRLVLCMARQGLRDNPDMVDVFLANPVISAMVKERDEEYDIDTFARTLKGAISDTQCLTVIIPRIPLLSPCAKTVSITSSDLDKIVRYLHKVDSLEVE